MASKAFGNVYKLRDVLSVRDPAFGARGDGTTDDTVALQAALDAATAAAIVWFPGKDYITSAQLTVDKILTIQGQTQYATAIICLANSGLLIDKVNAVQLRNIEIATAVRYTTTPNAYIGIEVAGDNTNRPSNHLYKDVYVDGFQTAYKAAYLWTSLFDNFRCNNGLIGLHVTALSVANTIVNSHILGSGAAGSRGLYFDSNAVAGQEGWIVASTLVDHFEINVLGVATTHNFLLGNQFDHAGVYGINILDDGSSNFGGNWTIVGNYVAMDGTAGEAAIRSNNTVASSQQRGNMIALNQVLVYSGKVCNYGILQSGAEDNSTIILANTCKGFATRDIRVIAGDNAIVAFNQMQSAGGFYADVPVNYWMNVGVNAAPEANISDVQGTYTPTLTIVTNLDSVTPLLSFYNRRGNQVTVHGKFNADPTAGANTAFRMSLPIASDLAAEQDVAGVAFGGNTTAEGARIFADATNNEATVQWLATTTVNAPWSFQFSYLIK